MRILVCGGRDFKDQALLARTLAKYRKKKNLVIIHGGARGADTLADDWAVCWNIRVKVYEADWDTHGKAAGSFRNQRMLDEGKPDLVIAFPGGNGTKDMVSRSKSQGFRVIEVVDDREKSHVRRRPRKENM